MRDQAQIVIDDFRGHWDRGLDDTADKDHFIDTLNIKYDERRARTREGTKIRQTFANKIIVGTWAFQFRDDTYPRTFYCVDKNDGSGDFELYDDQASLTTPFCTGAARAVAMVMIFNRVYISFGDGETGDATVPIEVYDPHTSGAITALQVVNSGSGYSVNDVLTIVEAGASGGTIKVLTLDAVVGRLTAAQRDHNGSGYVAGDIVNVTGGGGTGATLTILTVSGSGGVNTFSVTTGGSGYAAGGSNLATTGGTGTGFTVKTLVVSTGTGVGTYTILTGGSGYTTSLTVARATTVAPPGGTGATFYITAVVSSCRNAAGAPPSGFTLGVADGAAGKIEAGVHVYAVAFETESGFITAPGPVAWTVFNNAGSKKANISNIPIGPTGTVSRHILVTKVVNPYTAATFNQLNYELFFAPGGEVADNSSTTLTGLDFLDSELISSADYLIDQLSTIPSGNFLTVYNGRMVVGGEHDNPHILRVSKSGAPESFQSPDGFITVNPDDIGAGLVPSIKNGSEFRGLFYIFKIGRTYVTRDNGDEAGTWTATLVDDVNGCGYLGLGRLPDARNIINDTILVAGKTGIMAFRGSYDTVPLTYQIDDIWKGQYKINSDGAANNSLVIDPIAERLYCNITDDNGVLTKLIVGDFKQGLDPEKIKWSVWEFPGVSVSFLSVIPVTGGGDYDYVLSFCDSNGTGYCYVLDSTKTRDAHSADNDTAIESYAEFALLQFEESDGLSMFAAIRLRALGSGNLQITLSSEDRVTSYTAPVNLALSNTPGKNYLRLLNFVSEKASLKLRMNQNDEYFELNKVILFGNQYAEERPA